MFTGGSIISRKPSSIAAFEFLPLTFIYNPLRSREEATLLVQDRLSKDDQNQSCIGESNLDASAIRITFSQEEGAMACETTIL